MSQNRTAVTMGDPAGIGPEIVVRALQDDNLRRFSKPVVIGDPAIIERAAEMVGSSLSIKVVSTPQDTEDESIIPVIVAGTIPGGSIKPGTMDARWGESAAACCIRAVEMAEAGEVRTIVSTPFNKEAFHLAGYEAMDDMTFFQDSFKDSGEAYMVGEVAGIWVTTVTFHVSFKDIADLITIDSVISKIRSLSQVLSSIGSESLQRVGVAGLNVHAGEGGMFGREEIDIIEPAIKQAQDEGYDVVGPVPPDSLFPNAVKGKYAGVVCMYHDQANIGRKILGMKEPGVTIYKGMPATVLTVPHGTAYDIAWQGVATHEMLSRAIKMAGQLAHG